MSLLDLPLLNSVVVIGGMDPGVFALVFRRWVLVLFPRTREFVGLVLVITLGAFLAFQCVPHPLLLPLHHPLFLVGVRH